MIVQQIKIVKIFLIQFFLAWLLIGTANASVNCGETFYINSSDETNPADICQCGNYSVTQNAIPGPGSAETLKQYCCGYYRDNQCMASEDPSQYACGETNGSATIPEGASCNCEGGSWQSYVSWNFLWQNRDVCCGWVKNDVCYAADPEAQNVFCGDTYQTSLDSDNATAMQCICGGGGGKVPMNNGTTCCGWVRDGECKKTDAAAVDAVDAETLNSLNPLAVGDGNADLSTPGGFITRALGSFVFPIAGIILFVQLILGGFQMLAGASESKSIDEGKQKITAAIIGFLLLFAAYWMAQLLEIIFGIRILS